MADFAGEPTKGRGRRSPEVQISRLRTYKFRLSIWELFRVGQVSRSRAEKSRSRPGKKQAFLSHPAEGESRIIQKECLLPVDL